MAQTLEFKSILDTARRMQGEQISTLGGRATFTAKVVAAGIEVTPTSTGRPRLLRNGLKTTLAIFNETRSFDQALYKHRTVHASYSLALIKMTLDGR